ncbi:MAG TPA: autotransporter outer membrane beta-barrel domain-containing protein, partial [Gammaproteobacteria bacterium]|nr:autotransporter outer membrane beta-barrel domain-containing protein [Gammaproteobacteria bacterium]
TDEPDTHYANIGLGLSLQFKEGAAAFINYDTTLGLSNMTNHSLIGGIRLEF